MHHFYLAGNVPSANFSIGSCTAMFGRVLASGCFHWTFSLCLGGRFFTEVYLLWQNFTLILSGLGLARGGAVALCIWRLSTCIDFCCGVFFFFGYPEKQCL